jgi:hypothetical protein
MPRKPTSSSQAPKLPDLIPPGKTVPPGQSWRDYLKIHPLADRFPLLSGSKLIRMGYSIKKIGLKLRCEIGIDESGESVLVDGRNRLDAMEAIGLPINFSDPDLFEKLPPGTDLPAHIEALNIDRRHLDAAWIEEYLAGKIKENPDKSNRAIAADAEKDGIKLDKNKVSKKRKEMESTGEVAPVDKTVGQDGRSRTTEPKRSEAAEPEPIVVPPAAPKPPKPSKPTSSDAGLLIDAVRILQRAIESATGEGYGLNEIRRAAGTLRRLLDAWPSLPLVAKGKVASASNLDVISAHLSDHWPAELAPDVDANQDRWTESETYQQ